MKYIKRIILIIAMIVLWGFMGTISLPGVLCSISECSSMASRLEFILPILVLALAIVTLVFTVSVACGAYRHWTGKIYIGVLAVTILSTVVYYVARGVMPVILV
jgi:hypothetical protein